MTKPVLNKPFLTQYAGQKHNTEAANGFFEHIKHFGMTLTSKLHSRPKDEHITFEEDLLPFSLEYPFFPSSVSKRGD
jgi:hypothetical protein